MCWDDLLLQVEQEEEYITNKLMKRLEQLKNEKQSLANEVEQEEEYLINNLQKRLEKLNNEKIDLERQLEAEQEYIVNKLQKKVGACHLCCSSSTSMALFVWHCVHLRLNDI